MYSLSTLTIKVKTDHRVGAQAKALSCCHQSELLVTTVVVFPSKSENKQLTSSLNSFIGETQRKERRGSKKKRRNKEEYDYGGRY